MSDHQKDGEENQSQRSSRHPQPTTISLPGPAPSHPTSPSYDPALDPLSHSYDAEKAARSAWLLDHLPDLDLDTRQRLRNFAGSWRDVGIRSERSRKPRRSPPLPERDDPETPNVADAGESKTGSGNDDQKAKQVFCDGIKALLEAADALTGVASTVQSALIAAATVIHAQDLLETKYIQDAGGETAENVKEAVADLRALIIGLEKTVLRAHLMQNKSFSELINLHGSTFDKYKSRLHQAARAGYVPAKRLRAFAVAMENAKLD
jgi:hypothetical protein